MKGKAFYKAEDVQLTKALTLFRYRILRIYHVIKICEINFRVKLKNKPTHALDCCVHGCLPIMSECECGS